MESILDCAQIVDSDYVIYKHTNKLNGKSYIGMSKDVNKRWGKDGNGYRGYDSIFRKAIDKYGWDGFTHEIIEANLSFEDAKRKETYYIDLYKTNVCRYGRGCGYNMTDGGEGCSGRICSDETRTRISDKLSNPSSGTLKKMSDAAIGRCGRKSKPLNDTQRNALFAGRDKRNRKVSRPVYCITNGVLYESIEEAGRDLGLKYTSHISEVCKGKRPHEKGYLFEYAPMDEDSVPEDLKAVECIDTGEFFETARDAAKHIGVSTSYIMRCCNGKQLSTRGLRWRFA